MVSKEDVVQILSSKTHWNPDELSNLINDPRNFIPSLRLDQIKSIARELKNEGYPISLYLNKPQLALALSQVIIDIVKPQGVPSLSSHNAPPPSLPQLSKSPAKRLHTHDNFTSLVVFFTASKLSTKPISTTSNSSKDSCHYFFLEVNQFHG